jgi:hypothetical protein
MAPRLADVIEEVLKTKDFEYYDAVRDVAEELEAKLQDNFVILPKNLEGKK